MLRCSWWLWLFFWEVIGGVRGETLWPNCSTISSIEPPSLHLVLEDVKVETARGAVAGVYAFIVFVLFGLLRGNALPQFYKVKCCMSGVCSKLRVTTRTL